VYPIKLKQNEMCICRDNTCGSLLFPLFGGLDKNAQQEQPRVYNEELENKKVDKMSFE